MKVQIKGLRVIKTINGDVTKEDMGVGIPDQFRTYFTNPLALEGDIQWYQKCLIPETGEVLPAVRPKMVTRIQDLDKDEVLLRTEEKTISIAEMLECLKQFYVNLATANEIVPEVVPEVVPTEEV